MARAIASAMVRRTVSIHVCTSEAHDRRPRETQCVRKPTWWAEKRDASGGPTNLTREKSLLEARTELCGAFSK
eukprot:352117-Lingulodinium_polyedra.AAC.1